jgi:hypothetical protein
MKVISPLPLIMLRIASTWLPVTHAAPQHLLWLPVPLPLRSGHMSLYISLNRFMYSSLFPGILCFSPLETFWIALQVSFKR